MKNTITLILTFLLFSLNSSWAQGDLPPKSSAEDRIAYNKENKLSKYTGVKVQYTYKIQGTGVVPNALINTAQRTFLNVLDVQVQSSRGNSYWIILTDGTESNDERYHQLLNKKFLNLIERPVKYLL